MLISIIGIWAALNIGWLTFLLESGEFNYNIESPMHIYKTTSLNKIGAWALFMLKTLGLPLITIIQLVYWVCHTGRND